MDPLIKKYQELLDNIINKEQLYILKLNEINNEIDKYNKLSNEKIIIELYIKSSDIDFEKEFNNLDKFITKKREIENNLKQLNNQKEEYSIMLQGLFNKNSLITILKWIKSVLSYLLNIIKKQCENNNDNSFVNIFKAFSADFNKTNNNLSFLKDYLKNDVWNNHYKKLILLKSATSHIIQIINYKLSIELMIEKNIIFDFKNFNILYVIYLLNDIILSIDEYIEGLNVVTDKDKILQLLKIIAHMFYILNTSNITIVDYFITYPIISDLEKINFNNNILYITDIYDINNNIINNNSIDDIVNKMNIYKNFNIMELLKTKINFTIFLSKNAYATFSKKMNYICELIGNSYNNMIKYTSIDLINRFVQAYDIYFKYQFEIFETYYRIILNIILTAYDIDYKFKALEKNDKIDEINNLSHYKTLKLTNSGNTIKYSKSSLNINTFNIILLHIKNLYINNEHYDDVIKILTDSMKEHNNIL